MALVEVNEMRRLENRKEKWYGFRTFVCPTEEVIQHVTALRNQPFPEAVPGICVCNDTRTQYDADKTDGRAKIHAFYGPIDIGGGRRPRRKQYAQLFTSPSGRTKKLKEATDHTTQQLTTIEGTESQVPRGCNEWVPGFDNTIPDGIQRVTVRTAVKKPFSSGTIILKKGGSINKAGGQWDWFGFGAETLYFLGMQTRTDFDDDSLVAIDYDFLYDRLKWNENKFTSSKSYVGIRDFVIEAKSLDPAQWPVLANKDVAFRWVPGIYVENGANDKQTISTQKAKKNIDPYKVESFDFLQGMKWW